jgi:hypothetical protein
MRKTDIAAMRLNVVNRSFTMHYDERGNGDDEAVRRVSLDMNARTRRAVLRNRRAFVRHAVDCGVVDAPGCDCSHCMNDWDCCGCMVPSTAYVVPRKGGVLLIQRLVRNV